MDDPSQPHSRQPARLVYLCGLSDVLRRDFCRYFRESIEDCELRIFNLEDGMRTAILQNPNFLFVYVETSDHLARVSPEIAFLRCKLPHVNRILICSPELAGKGSLDEVSLDGILMSDAKRSDLIACLNNVGRGLRYVHPNVYRGHADIPALPDTITYKEEEILRYISMGMQNKQIADIVHISRHTVKNHKSNMVEKLGLSGTTELYKYAIQHFDDVVPELEPFDK